MSAPSLASSPLRGTQPVHPFRPLFLAASAASSLGLLLWGAFLHLGFLPQGPLPPILWHGHAMLFGFAGALVGGFLLTAAGNWTGRPTAGKPALGALCAAWLLAQIALLAPVAIWIGAGFELAYLLGLAVLLARVVIATRNRRNYFVIGLLLAYAALDLTFFIGASRDQALAAQALFWTVDWLSLLMLVIGGRVIPFFTGRRMPQVKAVDYKLLAGIVNVSAALALTFDIVALAPQLRGGLWLSLAVLTLVRMLCWRGWRTGSEPMLWSLHLGYAWLAIGMALRGMALLGIWSQSETTAMHGITVGALGTLSLAMMTRVAQGHGGATIRASRWLALAFVLPSIAALLRLAGPPVLWTTAATLWTLAFLIYLFNLGPLLVRGRPPAGE